ncbi:MAG: radical SAM/SPASM domain-containing protein [Candidatus Aenigmatarchaeota archaeon]
MDGKLERIEKWEEGGRAGPYTLEINPTNRCNLACRFCWQRITEPNLSKELSEEKLLKTIDEANELDVKEIRIPGSGEPLLRRNTVIKMMKRIKEHDIHGLIITNGTFLDEDFIQKMVDWQWDNLTVSLDGPDAKTHDFLRQRKGTFEKVKRSLELLKETKERNNSKRPRLRFHTVLTNKNHDKLLEMVEFADKYNCEDIKLQPMTPFSNLGEQCMFEGDREKLNERLTEAGESAEEYGINTNFKSFIGNDVVERTNEMQEVVKEASQEQDGFASAPCFEPWYNMVILPDGKTAQCSMFGGKGGVQVKNSSLEEIWYGDYFEKTRERLLNHELFDYCENCCVAVNMENRRIRERLRGET